jgi:hypothetical protein
VPQGKELLALAVLEVQKTIQELLKRKEIIKLRKKGEREWESYRKLEIMRFQ